MVQNAILQSGQKVDVGKRALGAAWFGYFVDMFDIYLPVLVLAPAMSYFLPKNLSISTSTTIYYMVFIASLLGRPIGSFIFGHYSDKIGRKRTTLVAVGGFAVLTLVMACLPGYVQWGIAAVIALTAIRFVCGIFLGGEYTAANPLAMEYAPQEKRGFYGALICTAFPVAFVIMSLLTLLMLKVTPVQGGMYGQWGWRLPFLLGVILAVYFILWFNKNIPESELWQKSVKSKEPLKDLFSGEAFRHLLQVFLVLTGLWFTLDTVSSVLPGVMEEVLKVPAANVTNILLFAFAFLILGHISAGVISQRIGRRVALIWYGVISVVVCPILYYFIIADYKQNIVGVAVLIIILIFLTCSPWGMSPSYLTERFKTGIRASGYGISYSLAVVIPAFYSFYMLWLQHFMPYKFTEIVLLVLGGILIVVGAIIGPETKDVVFEPSKE